MKKYHITFRFGDLMALGKNYEAKNEIQALEMFRIENPDAIFLYCASEELFKMKM